MRFLVLLAAMAVSGAASAQMLPAGTWTGTWTEGRNARPATAEIERCETGFRVVLTAGGRTARTETATWQRGRLRFTTDRARLPGMTLARALTCDLTAASDGRLSGVCTAGRARYPLALSPPADGAFGCD